MKLDILVLEQGVSILEQAKTNIVHKSNQVEFHGVDKLPTNLEKYDLIIYAVNSQNYQEALKIDFEFLIYVVTGSAPRIIDELIVNEPLDILLEPLDDSQMRISLKIALNYILG